MNKVRTHQSQCCSNRTKESCRKLRCKGSTCKSFGRPYGRLLGLGDVRATVLVDTIPSPCGHCNHVFTAYGGKTELVDVVNTYQGFCSISKTETETVEITKIHFVDNLGPVNVAKASNWGHRGVAPQSQPFKDPSSARRLRLVGERCSQSPRCYYSEKWDLKRLSQLS
jgi:hypothetical protein